MSFFLHPNYPSEWPQSAGFHWLFDSWFSDFWKLKLENKTENWKLKITNWKLKVENWKLKFEIVCGNTVQLWPPTVASHCGLPLWPPIVGGHGNTAQNCFWQISLCFLTGGHGRPQWEAMGIPLKIAFDKFPYVFLPEATGGHGNTARAQTLDLNSLFFCNVRTPNSVRWLGNDDNSNNKVVKVFNVVTKYL